MENDFLHNSKLANPDGNIEFNDATFNEALIAIEDQVLLNIVNKVLTEYGLPATDRQAINIFEREVQSAT